MTRTAETRRGKLREEGTILVISDLHMTSGKDPVRGTWSPTEDFFWDTEFAEFLEFYGRGRTTTLVINGDMLDFLQVLATPSRDEARQYGIPASDISLRNGLRCSERAAVYQVDIIIDGHPIAFRALAEFIGRGNDVRILKGNHDVQLFWPEVQARIRRRLEEFLPRGKRRRIRQGLEFLPWVFYVPGVVFVEHGNQYEAATSFSNFLHPVLPFDSPGTGRQIELDLGSFLVRYFSNRMEVLNILTDNYRPLADYLHMFFRRHPLVFLSTARDALRYVTKTVAKAHRTRQSARSAAAKAIAAQNAKLLRAVAERAAGRPEDAEWLHDELKTLDARKAKPILSYGVNRFLHDLLRGPVSSLYWLIPLYLVTYIPAAAEWVQRQTRLAWDGWLLAAAEWLFLFRIPQALLLLGLLVVALEIRRLLQRRKSKRLSVDDPILILRREAADHAARFKVPCVVFGHTHVEDELALPGGSKYFNSGTWIGVFSEQGSLYRNIQQFTFVRIQNRRGELLRWDPGRGRPRPVVVVDAGPFKKKENINLFSTLWHLLRRS